MEIQIVPGCWETATSREWRLFNRRLAVRLRKSGLSSTFILVSLHFWGTRGWNEVQRDAECTYGLREIFLNSMTSWPRNSEKLNKSFMGLKMQIRSHADKTSRQVCFQIQFLLTLLACLHGQPDFHGFRPRVECFTVFLIVGSLEHFKKVIFSCSILKGSKIRVAAEHLRGAARFFR